MKKYVVASILLLTVFSCYYLFQFFNYAPHPLNSSEYDVIISRLDGNNHWIPFQKESNLSMIEKDQKKTIKSLLTFKKSGELSLEFTSVNQGSNAKLFYQIYHNSQMMDFFNLLDGEHHFEKFLIKKGDTVEFFVEAYGEKPYWGTVESTFYFFSLSYKDKLIPILWGTLFLFLFYRGYGYLFFLIYFSFFIFLISEKLNFSFLNFEILLWYSFLLFFWTFLLLFVYQLGSRFKRFNFTILLVFLLNFLFLIIPLLFMLYALNFDHALTRESLYATFQSNHQESMEYVEKFVDFKYMLLFFFINLLLWFLAYCQKRKEVVQKFEHTLLLFLIMVFAIISYVGLSKYRLSCFIVENLNMYKEELQLFREVKAKRALGLIDLNATKRANGETYVVLIGESLSKNHMGIYGYERKTTPYLSSMRKDLILYQNAYSNHTHTVPVLSLALTEANQYNSKDYFSSPSIVEIFKHAGIETYWLSNQILYGLWDNKVSVIATEADHVVALNHAIGKHVVTQQYDEVLIEKLKEIFRIKSQKNRVIFIHLMGSHSSYASRYPKEGYEQFSQIMLETKEGVKIKDPQELNRYDNSIYYNDYVVGSLLKLLKKEDGVNAFLYFSDHAEDIERDVGHSWEKFSYAMTEIPLIAWFSTSYKKTYPLVYKNFLEHKNELFSNDMIYDTLIGLVGIDTKHHEVRYDLTSKSYVLEEENALVLHGKKKYATPENKRYWQRKKEKQIGE